MWSNLVTALRDQAHDLQYESTEILEYLQRVQDLEQGIVEEAEAEAEAVELEDDEPEAPTQDMLLDASNFEQVEKSDEVWLVEFGSEKCGSCQQFHPRWLGMVQQVGNTVHTGHVVIDRPAGMDVAIKYGVLNAGIPHVALFNRKGMPPTSLMAGELADVPTLVASLNDHVADLPVGQGGAKIKRYASPPGPGAGGKDEL